MLSVKKLTKKLPKFLRSKRILVLVVILILALSFVLTRGGAKKDAIKTVHAEVIQIEFDPKVISFDKLLEVFWYLHNPTTLNRQGNDVGTAYRSAIFYHDQSQKETAEKSKAQAQKKLTDKIVTEIVPFTKFYEAENYHKNYYDSNRGQGYCQIVIDPKIKKLLSEYKMDVKGEYLG